MKPDVLLFLFILTLVLPSCNQSKEDTMEVMSQVDLMQIPPPPQKKEVDVQPQAGPEISTDRKVIQEGTIIFDTKDAKTTGQQIAQAVLANKGYITEDSQSDYGTAVEHRVMIKVPAGNFDALLGTISKGADNLKSKSINAQDVTEEYMDVESRIKTKKELGNRYQQLLQKATKVEEMLAIEREMGTLRTEIESIEGRLRYLKDRVAFSTLTVIYNEIPLTSFGFLGKLGVSLRDGWDNLLGFLVVVVSLWPFLLLGTASLFLLRQYRKKRKTAKV